MLWSEKSRRKQGWGGDMEYRKQVAKSGSLVALVAFVARGSRSKLTGHSHLYFYHCSFLSCWQTVWEETARQVLREVEENKREDPWTWKENSFLQPTGTSSTNIYKFKTQFIQYCANILSHPLISSYFASKDPKFLAWTKAEMNQCHSCTQDTTWQGTNFKLYLCYQQPVSGKHLFPFL